jgi:hypothetical protein
MIRTCVSVLDLDRSATPLVRDRVAVPVELDERVGRNTPPYGATLKGRRTSIDRDHPGSFLTLKPIGRLLVRGPWRR